MNRRISRVTPRGQISTVSSLAPAVASPPLCTLHGSVHTQTDVHLATADAHAIVSRSGGCLRAAPKTHRQTASPVDGQCTYHVMRCGASKSGSRGVTDDYMVHTGSSTAALIGALDVASCEWSGQLQPCRACNLPLASHTFRGRTTGGTCTVRGVRREAIAAYRVLAARLARHLEGQLAARYLTSSLVMRRRGRGQRPEARGQRAEEARGHSRRVPSTTAHAMPDMQHTPLLSVTGIGVVRRARRARLAMYPDTQ